METYSSIEEAIEQNLTPLISKKYLHLYDLQGLAREVSDYNKTTHKYTVDEELLQDHLAAETYKKKYLNIPSHTRSSVLATHLHDPEGLLNKYGVTQEQYDNEIENLFMRTVDALDYSRSVLRVKAYKTR